VAAIIDPTVIASRPAFHGSALISANAWRHLSPGTDEPADGQRIGLVATLLTWQPAAQGGTRGRAASERAARVEGPNAGWSEEAALGWLPPSCAP
jgi:hypothetical protein